MMTMLPNAALDGKHLSEEADALLRTEVRKQKKVLTFYSSIVQGVAGKW
jgi:hypothetical protein